MILDKELEIVLDDNRLVRINDASKLMSSNTYDSITIDNLEIAKIKKELVCKCMGIAFYIWNTKRKQLLYYW